MMKNILKSEKGVNLTSLTVAVIVILILTGITLYNIKDNLGVQSLKSMQSDIENLRDKISSYYAQYGKIPANTNDESIMKYTNIKKLRENGIISEQVDTGEFYVIDLAAIDNVTLSYGKDYEKIRSRQADTAEEINALEDLYIINEVSHNIFYVKGITLDEEAFYTDYTKEDVDKVTVEMYQISEEDENWSPEYDKTAIYRDKNEDTAYIPKGFKVSRKPGENTINEGLVISDVNSNEFVWVPVSKHNFKTEFVRHDYGNQGIEDSYFINTELTLGRYYEPVADGLTIDTTATNSIQEVQQMYKSVREHGGFYIGRYEAGNDGENNVLSQKGVAVYNNIGWSDSDVMTDETGGAVEKARGFSENYTSVTSTLCYGVQWDAVMRWINEDSELQGYLIDSTEVGNYLDQGSKIKETGIYKIKNIYDMAGNVWEWTMECFGTEYKIYRGGYYNKEGNFFPITYRNSNESYPSTSSESLGFRLALYIK